MIELQEYIKKEPEIVFEWKDAETDAEGWIVINSLRNGAAGGGTRMRKGLSKDEVVALAKVMEVKFSVSGPPIGGAKSGINFDPRDPRKREVLERWFKAVYPILKSYYGTGGDLNIDEIKDVVPITENLGLWHPQEGVIKGHFNYTEGKRIHALGQLRYGCAKIIENQAFAPVSEKKLAVADMITGYGVAESIKHYYDLFHSTDVQGKRVLIQGWGNVASAAGYYLSQAGAKLVGVMDKDGGIIEEQGMDFNRVRNLFLEKDGNQLADASKQSFEQISEKFWDVPADIFIPGAASRLITREQVDRLIAQDLSLIACGANVPFIDDEIFFGPTAEYTDEKISLIPDFIANCGMARTFAYLMQENQVITDENLFSDVSETIQYAMQEILKESKDDKSITRTAFSIAMNKLN